MSQEMHIIYSKNIKGSSSIGSGPFMMSKALTWYENEKKLTNMAIDYTESFFAQSKIDDPKFLKDAAYFQVQLTMDDVVGIN